MSYQRTGRTLKFCEQNAFSPSGGLNSKEGAELRMREREIAASKEVEKSLSIRQGREGLR